MRHAKLAKSGGTSGSRLDLGRMSAVGGKADVPATWPESPLLAISRRMRVCEESETFPRAWRLNRSTISTNLELIWEMSVKRQGSSGDGSKAVTENTLNDAT